MTIFHSLESRRVACDLLSLCIFNDRLCLQNEEMDTFPGKREYVFPNMEGRRQDGTRPQPPCPLAPALALAPERGQERTARASNTPCSFHVCAFEQAVVEASHSLPLLHRQVWNSAKIPLKYCRCILWTPSPVPPHTSADWISLPSPCAPRRGRGYGKIRSMHAARTPQLDPSLQLGTFPKHTHPHTHILQSTVLWLRGWAQDSDGLGLSPSFVTN